jgi:hypothetical protein
MFVGLYNNIPLEKKRKGEGGEERNKREIRGNKGKASNTTRKKSEKVEIEKRVRGETRERT